MSKLKTPSGKLLRCALLGGACLAALPAVPAVAQNSDTMETVVVTGIRGELQRNLDIKREAVGLVDAVTSEDIGKFPDANLANALMRIPGVTTSLASNMTNNGQQVTTGQGTSITVRGFGPTFNETLFDGRVIPSGVGGRAFDFSGLSADMVSQLQVLKSPDATLSAGAIGATINVVYPKPFDKPGLTIAASASGNVNANDGRWKPNGNFLISNTFDNDKIGVLVAGAYSSLSGSQQQFQNWGWIGMNCTASVNAACNPASPSYDATIANKPIWFTQDYAVDFNRIQEERMNGRVAVQFQPTDALVITLDANYARDDLNEDSLAYALWNSVGEMTHLVRSNYGTITSFNRAAPSDFDDVRSQQVQQTYNYGLNAKWDVNSHVTVIADFDQAMSALQPGRGEHFAEVSEDLGYGPSAQPCTYGTTYDPVTGFGNTNPNCPTVNSNGTPTGGNYAATNGMTYSVVQPGGHSVPYYTGVGPGGVAANFLDTSLMGSHVMVVTNQENRNLTNEAKLEGDFSYDNLTFKVGGSYDANHFRGTSYNSFWGNQWQIYSGYGPASNNIFYQGMSNFYDASVDGVTNAAGVFTPNTVYVNGSFPSNWVWCKPIHNWCTPSGTAVANPLTYFAGTVVPDQGQNAGVVIPTTFFTGTRSIRSIPGWKLPTGGVIPGLPVFNAFSVYNYLNSLGVPATATSINGFNWGYGSGYTGAIPAQMAKWAGNYFVEEDNWAAYVSFGTETKLGSMPLKINGGVRYEYTDMTTSGLGTPLASINVDPADHTAFDFVYGASTNVKATNTYGYLLPNIDLNLFVTDDLHLRFDASRTLTRPPLGDLRATLSYGGRVGALSATGGNPYELPYTSDNVDVSAEWYYDQNSYVAADTFLKVVNNFVVAGTTTITVPGVTDPTTNAPAKFTLQSNVNGPSANIYGLELAWQHVFGDTGFGFLANGTLVGTDKPYNPNNLLVGNFAVPGLADSANFTAFYDNYGFEARLAANWRDLYLNGFGQGQASGTQFGSEPIFVEGSWDLTFSTSYDITDNVRVFFEADNLTDAAFATRGRFADQLYSVIAVGRSFTGGVHFKL